MIMMSIQLVIGFMRRKVVEDETERLVQGKANHVIIQNQNINKLYI